ncbi:gamma-glutamyl-gamma-aminobutyrate hydrolase family protein, partial [Streptomyces sp. NPDC005877]|uniref:gamma-glutamyl-gamma-aminobutyrate hydrolase family protein n=1 Tax=Streptomyces sp. NPDC005877 TaxID=3155346 RepID=UPI0033E159EB
MSAERRQERQDTVGRPLIGVSTYLEESVRWGVWHWPAAVLPAAYPRLVRAAGGLTAMLPPDDPESAAEVVARLDGVVVAGGPGRGGRRAGGARGAGPPPPPPARG